MLLSEIIYNIKNMRNGGTHTDDYALTDAQLEFIINNMRGTLVSQAYSNHKSVDGFTQTLEQVKLEACRDFRPDNHRFVSLFQSQEVLPIVCEASKDGYTYNFVGDRNDSFGYQSSSLMTYNIDLLNKFTGTVFFELEDRLYIATKNSKSVNSIYVKAAFENPRKVIEFNTGEPLVGYDWDYPVPVKSMRELNSLIIDNEYRWANLIPADMINDGKDA